MDNKSPDQVYVSMMLDALKRKLRILRELCARTGEQEKLLRTEKLDADRFLVLVNEKGDYIDELNRIDEGFDALFRRVEKEILAHGDRYRDALSQMKDLITDISELGVSIQALEKQNSERFKAFLARERQGIRNFHVNQRTISSYTQNMTNVHRENQSYFFNKTK